MTDKADKKTVKPYEHETPTPTQEEADAAMLALMPEAAKKREAAPELRETVPYEHETPTPTQAENDAAMQLIMSEPAPKDESTHKDDLPEGARVAEHQKRMEPAPAPAGTYQTRSATKPTKE